MGRSSLTPLGRTCAAGAGVVAGHVITYVLSFAAPHERHAALAESGHSYWATAVSAAAISGLVVLVGVGWSRFRAGYRGNAHAASTNPLTLWSSLAPLQIVLFLTVETVERVVSAAPLVGLFDHGVVAIGVLVQLAVALAISLILGTLGAAAEALGSLLAPKKLSARASGLRVPSASTSLRRFLLAGAVAIRAPPSA